MKIEELREELLKIKRSQEEDKSNSDPEDEHFVADTLLLDYINDKEVTEIFKSLHMWYA